MQLRVTLYSCRLRFYQGTVLLFGRVVRTSGAFEKSVFNFLAEKT